MDDWKEYNWNKFTMALHDLNAAGDLYVEELYPEFYNAMQTKTNGKYLETTDMIKYHINKAITVENITIDQCFSDYINTLLGGGTRYALESKYEIKEIIEYCISNGATIYPKELNLNFDYDDDIYSYDVYAYIIDCIKPEHIKHITDWSKINSFNYLCESQESIKKYLETSTERELIMSLLKYCSKYLQSL